MNNPLDDLFARILVNWVDGSRRHARPIVAVCVALTILLGAFAAMTLGINSDNVRLVAEHLPARRNHEAFARIFPNLENALLVVVDAETPELARDSSLALLAAIKQSPEHFTDAYIPGGGSFFETHGLLYREVEDLDIFGDQMAKLQPILATLEHDASLASLASLVERGLEEASRTGQGAMAPEDWSAILDSVGQATVAVYAEYPVALSWEQMLLRGSAVEVIKRRIIVVHPELDFDSLLSAGGAITELRRLAKRLDLDDLHGVRVRITGNPALNYEEMIGIAWDLGLGGVFCFLIVIGALTRALRSLRLVLAAVSTLLIGLVWTGALAGAAVGHLSLVSVSFGVLFIGLGVDFGIHLGMAYASHLREGSDHGLALREAVKNVGSSLLICTMTTAIGFFVFVPTDYRGVAELGLIAGGGMFIILGLTLTLFPALLSTVFRLNPESGLVKPLHFRTAWWRVFDTHPVHVCVLALLLFAAGLAQIPRARFDANVIEMRDPSTESVQAFNDLLSASGAMSPWFINSVAPDLASARLLASKMQALDTVSHTLTLASYVPADQDEKLEILADIAFLLQSPPAFSNEPESPPAFEDQVAALRRLHAFLDQPFMREDQSTLGESMRLLRSTLGDFLSRVASDEDRADAVATLEDLLLAGLPDQLARVRAAVNTEAITLENLPKELKQRMIASDGRARVQIFPNHDLGDETYFARFTDSVQRIDPKAAGVAINLVEFSRATRSSFRQALISAIVIISLLLLALWRRFGPMALVIAPLMLSSVLTVAAMVVLDIPFSFANVIVIPLLLGIGVDSGIHLVHRAEHAREQGEDLMDTTTARAVFYSALTTTISFGTLALSSHRGMASLGIVLSIGMLLTVACNLIVLPALIRLGGLGRASSGGARQV